MGVRKGNCAVLKLTLDWILVVYEKNIEGVPEIQI